MNLPGCPTALSRSETRLLKRWARGRWVVEFGSLLGHSTINMASVAKGVVSIDRHAGYSGETYNRFRSNIERAGLSSKVVPLIMNVMNLRKPIWAEMGFIDLTGGYDITRHSLRKINAPIIALHDVCRINCRGAERAMLHSGLKVIDSVDTLVVLGR